MNEREERTKVEPHCPTDREYVDIIKADSKIDPSFITETGQPAKIVYYCRECKKIVAPKRIGKKLSFKCGECNKESISFGTENSIASYYNIK
ncbi:hypothetical protein JXD20_03005 [Candidatus Peregrinibacteria bacterium]|nr:hypothetical protein [Candidatus Peregrinibacteria bacterium]